MAAAAKRSRTRSRARSRSRTTFTLPVRFEVRQPAFHLLASLRQLDIDKLSRAASARFEVGYFEVGDCRQLVRAVVRRGMVTGIEADPCPGDEQEQPSAELVRVLTAAGRRAGPGGPPVRFPIPVARFVSNAQALTIRKMVCYEICFFGWCTYCCQVEDGPWICGKKITIDTTP